MKTASSYSIVLIVALVAAFLMLGAEAAPAPEAPGAAPAPPPAAKGPKIEVDPVFKVGTIKSVGTTKLQLKVSNSGDADLVIDRVGTSCGCTTPSISEENKRVPPGGSSAINVDINPARMSNFDFDNVVIIFSNDLSNDTFTVHIIGTVEPEFVVEPGVVDFGTVRKGEPQEVTIRWRQMTDEPIEITKVESANTGSELLLFSFEKLPESEWAQPGHNEYDIKVGLNDRLTTPGPLREEARSMVIFPNHKRMHRYNVPVQGFVDSFYRLAPRRHLVINTAKNPAPVDQWSRRQLPVTSTTIVSDRPCEIIELTSPSGRLAPVSKPGPIPNSITIDVPLAPDCPPTQAQDWVYFTLKGGDEVVKDTVSVHLIHQEPKVITEADIKQKEITEIRLRNLRGELQKQFEEDARRRGLVQQEPAPADPGQE